MENQELQEQNQCKCCKNLAKVFLISFMSFLGCFCAFYILMHQCIIHLFPKPHHHFHRFERDMTDVMGNDFSRIRDFKDFQNKISAIQTIKLPEDYIIVVNLKKFNNDENNIKFNLEGNTVTVSGKSVKNNKHGVNEYFFTESFEIPETIKTDEISKEKIDDEYIIKLPIKN